MNIIINTSHQRFGGAVQVALSFINECKLFPEHEYHVFVGSGVGKSLDKSSFPSNFTFYDFDFGVIGFSTVKTIQKKLRPLEEKIKPDVLISTSGPTYYHSKAPQIIGFNLPLYIYPESPFVRKLPMKKKMMLWIKKQFHFYYFKRDAVAYVVQTDDVNRRVKKALNTEKVYTVTNTHNQFYNNPTTVTNKLPDKIGNEFRFLTLTSYYPHKNLELIPKVAQQLEALGITNVRFILTLKQEEFKEKLLNHKFIMNVGPVLPKDCPSLYAECDAMFLPTLAECFSASYPEAMVMKKPIVTTNLGFAKSICGDAALFFEPENAEDASKKIRDVMENKDTYDRLVNFGIAQLKTFDSAHSRAEKYLQICESFKLRS